MLAARYEQTGPAHDVIVVGEVETPEPGPGEVRVRVAVSGVNPTDWKTRSGTTPRPTDAPFQIPNQDGAGTIDAVGDGVDPAREGERVWIWLAAAGRPWGTAAEYTVVPAERAVPLPDRASFELGASLGVPALTAHRCLLADGPIQGATVLVAGGAGAVGRTAIELARWAGAGRVVATVSSEEKAAIARAAGAEATVDYKAPNALERLKEAAPDGVDRIVELSLGHNLALDVGAAAPDCVISSYANEGPNPELEVRPLMTANISLRFVLLYTMPRAAIEQAVADVSRALADAALTEPALHHFALEQTAHAHDAVEQGAVGKVVIDVA